MSLWAQPFYCEENAWQLLQQARFSGSERHALFIINHARRVAVWQQKRAPPGAPLIWDYHVVSLIDGAVWDPDSALSSPCPARDYFAAAFPPLLPEMADLAPRFRLVPAAVLFATFATDRRHMKAADGSWLAPPPPWPAPAAPGCAHNLDRFIDPDDPVAGEVLALEELAARFACG